MRLSRNPSWKRDVAARAFASLSLCWLSAQPLVGLAQTKPAAGASAQPQPATLREGQHDFDFTAGTWHTHVKHIMDPLADPGKSTQLDGTVSVRPVWGGRAWLEEIEADGGPKGHWEALSLFLYNPQARQWSQNFLNSRIGTLSPPLIGGFKDGRGELFVQDTFKDKTVLVRGVWSGITADAHTYEEAYSLDGGKTWSEPSFHARLTRIPASEVHPVADIPNDFDFENGAWKTRVSRLMNPLTGSQEWITADGTMTVRKIWGGKANLAEIRSAYPTGAVDFLAFRWYNPVAQQWFLSFATASGGQLGVPMAGTFKDGRIDFYDQEQYEGRAILVRLSTWGSSATEAHSEQAFSQDGGRTWEVNFQTKYSKNLP